MKYFLSLLALSSIFLVSSCGKDNSKKPPAEVSALSTNQTVAVQCGCTSEYKPICGLNTNGNTQTYDNECIAKCFSATTQHYMRCAKDQSESTKVCYSGLTKSETEAFQVPNSIWPDFYYGACGQKQM